MSPGVTRSHQMLPGNTRCSHMLKGVNRRNPITKPPLLKERRLTGGGSPNLVDLVERKVPFFGLVWFNCDLFPIGSS